jgi:hypothetical protein
LLTNFIDAVLTIPKNTVIGLVEDVNEDAVNALGTKKKNSQKGLKENLYNKLLSAKLDPLKPEERQYLEPLLRKYASVFHYETSNDFKAKTVTEHEINLEY